MQRLIFGFAVLMSLSIGCTEDAPLEPNTDDVDENPEISSTTEEIVYASDQGGKFDIWRRHEETESRITILDGESWWPRISEDKTKLLYYHSEIQVVDVNDYSSAGLWVMDTDGENRKEIIPANANGWEQHGFANWSPDGNRIVMCAIDPEIGNWQLYTTDAAGNDIVRVSRDSEASYFDPVFSPDGLSIACIRQPAGFEDTDVTRYEVYLIDIETGVETRITTNNHRDHHPDFSSDGSKIVFESLTEADYLGIGKWSLMEVDVASKEQSVLLQDENINIFPRYTKDDQAIYYNQVDLTSFNLRIARLSLETGTFSYLTEPDFNAMNVDPF